MAEQPEVNQLLMRGGEDGIKWYVDDAEVTQAEAINLVQISRSIASAEASATLLRTKYRTLAQEARQASKERTAKTSAGGV